VAHKSEFRLERRINAEFAVFGRLLFFEASGREFLSCTVVEFAIILALAELIPIIRGDLLA